MRERAPKGYAIHPHSQKYLGQGHFWVTSDRFSAEFPPAPGLMAALDHKKRPKWILLNDPNHSEVKARLWGEYSNAKIKTTNFWQEFESRLGDSIDFRLKQRLSEERDNYYLVFAEGDRLPGLFIQKLGDVVLTQIYCSFWKMQDRILSKIIQRICQDKFPTEALQYLFQSRNKQQKLEVSKLDYKGKLHALSDEVDLTINEFDLCYNLKFGKFYDFGIYSDMSSIRAKIIPYFKPGQKTLNLFSYTGAFSLQALKAEHTEVHSVDLSPQYMKALEENIEVNKLDLSKHVSHIEPVSNALKKFEKENVNFDHIICDPPSASSDGKKVSSALKNYDELIPAISKIMNKGGYAYLFLNTHQVTWKKFEEKINKNISLDESLTIEKRFNLSEDCRRIKGFPEGDYLKGILLKKN